MKERLTGAIILVALVVVLVPEALNGPIRPAARGHGPASPTEVAPLRSYTISLADEPRGGSGALEIEPAHSAPPAPAAELGGASRAAPSAAAPTATGTALATHAATSKAPTSTPSAAAAPASASTAPAASGSGYVVQLGSFASRSNAGRLAQQVRGLGYTVSVSRGTTGRHLYRVQVEPARERAAAEQLAAKLRAQGHAGAVVAR